MEDEIFDRLTSLSLFLSENLGLDVDVIPIYRDFRKPFLYYNAIILGIPLFVRNKKNLIDLKVEALYHMEDFFNILELNGRLNLLKKPGGNKKCQNLSMQKEG